MSFTYTLTILRGRTSKLAGDPNAERWGNTDLDRAINEALWLFELITKCLLDKAYIPLTDGTADYDLVATLLAAGSKDFIGLKFAEYLKSATYKDYPGGNKVLLPKVMREIDMEGIRQEDEAEPNHVVADIMPYGAVKLVPCPATSTTATYIDVLKIWYYSLSTELPTATPTTEIDSRIPVLFHQAIPFGAAAILLEDGTVEELAAAAGLWQQFYEFTAKFRDQDGLAETGYASFEPV